MSKQEMIEEYLKKVARKHSCTIEEAKEFQLTKNYITYIEKEGKDDSNNYNRHDLPDVDNIKCC